MQTLSYNVSMRGQFISWLETEMLKRRLGLRGLSRETRIAFSTISHWLNGKTEPNAANIEILAKFFDVDKRFIYELLGRTEPAKPTDLTPDEELLISRYRQFSESDKRKYLNMLSAMLGSEE